jgi:putative membrane protein insertion efficiency factor
MNRRDRVIAAAHGAYKLVLSPLLHAASGCTGACRFQPTCSEYAAIAVSEYGLLRGGAMALWRLLRCHPLCKGGFDPVVPNPHRPREVSQVP